MNEPIPNQPFTVAVLLMDGSVDVRCIYAADSIQAEKRRQSFCALPDKHVRLLIDSVLGEPVSWVVLVEMVEPDADGCVSRRVTVEAADEGQAGVVALWTLACEKVAAHRIAWVERTVPDHAHVTSSSLSCDGHVQHFCTVDLPDAKLDRASRQPETPRERMGRLFADRELSGLVRFGVSDFKVQMPNEDTILVDRATDEGGVCVVYQLCDDELCFEHGKASQRDQFAESMGY